MRAAAVIVAGGAGTRFGGPVRKQYLRVGGEPVLLRAIRPFLAHPRIAAVVVVLPADDVADPPAWLAELPVRIVDRGNCQDWNRPYEQRPVLTLEQWRQTR